MAWLDKLEKRFGYLAIPHLGMTLVAAQALATLVAMKDPRLVSLMVLEPSLVAQGQWWRLLTFLVVPSLSPFNLIFAIFWFQFLWGLMDTLEAEWGRFKLTAYVGLAVLLPGLASLGAWQALGVNLVFTGSYLSTSLLLAYAFLAPEATIYLMMILPVKMRWWAWLVGAYYIYSIAVGGPWEALAIAAGVGNYLIFFLPEHLGQQRLRASADQGQAVLAAARRQASAVLTRSCTQCGRGVEADLRLCTCPSCGEEGRHWCLEHLAPHLAPGATKKRKG